MQDVSLWKVLWRKGNRVVRCPVIGQHWFSGESQDRPSEEVIHESRLKGWGRATHARRWGKSISGRGSSEHEDSKVSTGFAWSRNRKKIHVVRVQWGRGRRDVRWSWRASEDQIIHSFEGQGEDWSFTPKTWEATEEFYVGRNMIYFSNSFLSKIIHHKTKKKIKLDLIKNFKICSSKTLLRLWTDKP